MQDISLRLSLGYTPPTEASSQSKATLAELFAENVIAKVIRTAQAALSAVPEAFPETVAADSDGAYSLREAEFWTCGFFPGTLYLTLERLTRYPQSVTTADPRVTVRALYNELKPLCEAWSQPLHSMADRADTHDIGFIVMPALRLDWELFGHQASLDSIIRAAYSLATRYVPESRAIRSWDMLNRKDIEILDQNDNLIVIIDSMCNLNLLSYAACHGADARLAEIATEHAKTVMRSHLRPEQTRAMHKDAFCSRWFSTCHVANIDLKTGSVKARMTAQRYADESTWSRGQAWGILGFAETYAWTRHSISRGIVRLGGILHIPA